jgi:hypothetical protein
MQRIAVEQCPPHQILARPVHGDGGGILLAAGTPLDAAHRQLLVRHGIRDVLVQDEGTPLPDISIPAYMDRYSDDFAPRLHAVFDQAMVNRSMQELFLKALAHASHCFRRYRLDTET